MWGTISVQISPHPSSDPTWGFLDIMWLPHFTTSTCRVHLWDLSQSGTILRSPVHTDSRTLGSLSVCNFYSFLTPSSSNLTLFFNLSSLRISYTLLSPLFPDLPLPLFPSPSLHFLLPDSSTLPHSISQVATEEWSFPQLHLRCVWTGACDVGILPLRLEKEGRHAGGWLDTSKGAQMWGVFHTSRCCDTETYTHTHTHTHRRIALMWELHSLWSQVLRAAGNIFTCQVLHLDAYHLGHYTHRHTPLNNHSGRP